MSEHAEIMDFISDEMARDWRDGGQDEFASWMVSELQLDRGLAEWLGGQDELLEELHAQQLRSWGTGSFAWESLDSDQIHELYLRLQIERASDQRRLPVDIVAAIMDAASQMRMSCTRIESVFRESLSDASVSAALALGWNSDNDTSDRIYACMVLGYLRSKAGMKEWP